MYRKSMAFYQEREGGGGYGFPASYLSSVVMTVKSKVIIYLRPSNCAGATAELAALLK